MVTKTKTYFGRSVASSFSIRDVFFPFSYGIKHTVKEYFFIIKFFWQLDVTFSLKFLKNFIIPWNLLQGRSLPSSVSSNIA
jgi:hypothetical protein